MVFKEQIKKKELKKNLEKLFLEMIGELGNLKEYSKINSQISGDEDNTKLRVTFTIDAPDEVWIG